MNIEEKKNFLINAAFTLLIAALVYVGFRYLLPITAPFLLALCVSYGVVKLSDRLRPHCKPLRALLILLVYGAIGSLLALLIVRGITAGSAIVSTLPDLYHNTLMPAVTSLFQRLDELVASLDPGIRSTIENISGSLLSSLEKFFSAFSGFLVNFVSGAAKGVPTLVVSILVMIIATFFIALDYDKMASFLNANMPETITSHLLEIRSYLTNTLFVVIRSYLLIMLLTFTELFLLFSIFGIQHAFFRASIIAVLDILPVLGTGGILIPWGIISLFQGYTALGIKLLVTYGIVMVVRNYAEPKIVGAQLGLHPIITLVSMFIGLRLFGFWGMFGIPITISFLWKRHQRSAAS